eukprot:ctg_225.g83
MRSASFAPIDSRDIQACVCVGVWVCHARDGARATARRAPHRCVGRFSRGTRVAAVCWCGLHWPPRAAAGLAAGVSELGTRAHSRRCVGGGRAHPGARAGVGGVRVPPGQAAGAPEGATADGEGEGKLAGREVSGC